MQTSELTGAALDWAVAQCEGYKLNPQTKDSAWISYSTDWAQGGPIIDRELIETMLGEQDAYWIGRARDMTHAFGPTPLIAAMRCYVSSKLGDEVEIQEELIK